MRCLISRRSVRTTLSFALLCADSSGKQERNGSPGQGTAACLSGPDAGLHEAILVQLLVEGDPANAQFLSGPQPVIAVVVQRLQDAADLRFLPALVQSAGLQTRAPRQET